MQIVRIECILMILMRATSAIYETTIDQEGTNVYNYFIIIIRNLSVNPTTSPVVETV